MDSQRNQFGLGFVIVTVILLTSSIGIINWIRSQVGLLAPVEQTDPAYVNYSTQPGEGEAPYLMPESLQRMAEYTAEFPEPQNVQVLQGLSTAEIAGYMVNQVAGGLKVDCSHCHNINNFAEDGNANKDRARQMLAMTADLNQQFVSTLPPEAGGALITCATCHNGNAQFNTYPDKQDANPDNWRLLYDQLDSEYLQITGKDDSDLNKVLWNQQVMNHMNTSLGVGCDFCHNAAYFPSDEKPQKDWARTMLNMTTYMHENYSELLTGDSAEPKEPSCWMCHQGNYIPPGAASSNESVLAPVSTNPN
jgi:photosynthetic reaction center cytochrome c subunit